MKISVNVISNILEFNFQNTNYDEQEYLLTSI